MYQMSDEVKRSIERITGKSIADIQKMTLEEEKQLVYDIKGEEIKFSKRRKRFLHGRGNPLISRKKIRTIEDIEEKSKRLYGI
jgi:hypothetical protein